MKKILTAITFLCAFTLLNTVHAENWCQATVNYSGAWYVDSHSIMIEKASDDEFIFFAFVKQELSDYSREQYKRPNVEYRIFREEFKLSDGIKYFRVGATTNYNFDGSSYSDPVDTFDWDIIPAGSVAEYLYETTYLFLLRDVEE